MKKYIYGMVAAALCSMSLSSCFNDLDTLPIDDNQVVSEQVYTTVEGYMGVLAKCYASLILTGQQGGDGGDGDLEGANEGYSGYVRLLFYLQELTTDNFVMPSSSNGLRLCLNLTYGPTTAVNTWTYQRLYMSIAYCNEFLRECTEGKLHHYGLYEHFKDDYLNYRAEARLIRAYCYVMLCDLYGSAPIIHEDADATELPTPVSREELFKYVESELLAIAGESDSEDVLAAPGTTLFGHVDKCAAWYLLSRLYLNAETWIGSNYYQQAYEYSKKIIDSNVYPLASDYRHIFLADNDECSEIIFPLIQDGLRAQSSAGTNFYVKAFVNGPMDELYQTGVGSKGWGNVRSKTTLVDAFDPADVEFDLDDTWGNGKNDKRAQFMTKLETGVDEDGNTTYQTKETWDADLNMTSQFTCGYGYIKWRNVTKDDQICASGDTYTSINFPLMRTADCYLMAAEAILRGANGGRSLALEYVNKVRARAYMSDEYAVAGVSSAVSGKITDSELTLDFILTERQKELASECQRRTDLIRFGKYTSGYNWDWKGGERLGTDVESYKVLFPIPEDEITNNPNLDQNYGY
ncbi:MAG: RagB/SusD family nutrient uptake outer membrane protein [Bacteroidales bacterium]|nr:RagB/SusD family nutrient uptake outer membrane protein [Bacteroidales bacterium]